MFGIKVLLVFIFSYNMLSIKLFKCFDYLVWGELLEVVIMDGKFYSLIILGKYIDV